MSPNRPGAINQQRVWKKSVRRRPKLLNLSQRACTCHGCAGRWLQATRGWASSHPENYKMEWLKGDRLYSRAVGFLAMRESVTGKRERQTGAAGKVRMGHRYQDAVKMQPEPKIFGLHIFPSISQRLREIVMRVALSAPAHLARQRRPICLCPTIWDSNIKS